MEKLMNVVKPIIKWSYIYLVLLEETTQQEIKKQQWIQGFKQAWVDWMPQVIRNGLFIL